MVDVMDEVPNVTSFEERILIHRSFTSAGSRGWKSELEKRQIVMNKRGWTQMENQMLSAMNLAPLLCDIHDQQSGKYCYFHSAFGGRLLHLTWRNVEKKLSSFHAIYLLKILARLLCQESRFEREDNDNAVQKIARSNFHFPKKPLAILLTKTFLYCICFNCFNGISILALEKSNFKLHDENLMRSSEKENNLILLWFFPFSQHFQRRNYFREKVFNDDAVGVEWCNKLQSCQHLRSTTICFQVQKHQYFHFSEHPPDP